MPWLSILMALISFFATRRGDSKNNAKAALVGAATGLGTYYVTHETEWGRSNLGSFDGVVTTTADTTVQNADGSESRTNPNSTSNPTATVKGTDSSGKTILIPAQPASGGLSSSSGMLSDTLKAVTPTATQAVVGGGIIAAVSKKEYVPWIIGGIALFMLITRRD